MAETRTEREVTRVLVDPQGPTYIEGPVEVCVDGAEPQLIDRFRVAICACRCSKSYPLCDGTHNRTKRRIERTTP